MTIMSSRSGPARRDEVDTIRAIACIALVSYHAVGGSPAAGMELDSTHWLAMMNAALIDLRMPLFSFVSGYVFHVATTGAASGAAFPAGRS